MLLTAFDSVLVHEAVVTLDARTKTHTEAFIMLAPEVAVVAHDQQDLVNDPNQATHTHALRRAIHMILDATCRRRLPGALVSWSWCFGVLV